MPYSPNSPERAGAPEGRKNTAVISPERAGAPEGRKNTAVISPERAGAPEGRKNTAREQAVWRTALPRGTAYKKQSALKGR